MSLLSEYFLDDLTMLICQASQIKIQARCNDMTSTTIGPTGSMISTTISSTGSIITKFFPINNKAHSFAGNKLITLTGELASIESDVVILDKQLKDIISGDDNYYVNVVGQVITFKYNQGMVILELPEPAVLVSFLGDTTILYILTVTGQTMIYSTATGGIIFIDDNTDTVKISADVKSRCCFQLKLDGSITVMDKYDDISYCRMILPKGFERITNFITFKGLLVIKDNKGQIGTALITRKHSLTFEIDSTISNVVLLQGLL